MPMVTLVSGAEVDSASEPWRHECECRHILNLPTLQQRRAWLYGTLDQWGKYKGGLLQRRGEAAVKRIEATMLELWKARGNS